MSEHVPCEHCEEVRLEEEDKAFAEAMRAGLEAPEGSLLRLVTDAYIDDLMRVPLPLTGGPVKFTFWKDLDG